MRDEIKWVVGDVEEDPEVERRPPDAVAICLGGSAALGGVANLFRFDTLDALTGDLNLLGLTLAAAACLLSFLWPTPRYRAGVLMFAVFLTIALTSWLFPPTTPTASSKQALFVLTVPLLYLAGSRCLTWPHARRAFLVLLAACGLVTAVGLFAWGSVSMERTSFDGGDPISQGRVAAMGAAIGFVMLLRMSGIWRFMGLTLFGICGFGTLLTGSRGPLLVLGIAIVVLIFTGGGRHRFLRGFTALTVMAGSLWWVLSESGPVGRALGGDSASQSDSERSTILSGTLAVVADNPMGVGLGNLWRHLPPGALVPGAGERQYPHNVLLEAAAEGGILAGILLTALCLISGAGILRHRETRTGQMLIAVWIIGVGSAMTSSNLTGNRMMWVMLGVGIAAWAWGRAPITAPSKEHPTPDHQFGHP